MATNSPFIDGTNFIRFYVDNNDRIYKCDYVENIDGMYHEYIKLRPSELIGIFKRFVTDSRIEHEEKIYSDFILHKFYDVDVDEIDRIIQRSKEYQSKNKNYFEPAPKLTPIVPETKKTEAKSTSKFVEKKPSRKVTRKNLFKKRVVIASVATIVALTIIITAVINDITKNRLVTSSSNQSISMSTEETTKETEKETETYTLPEETIEEVTYDQYIDIYANNSVGDKKYTDCRNNYYDIIAKYARMYGIDPELAFAIACQERGYHSEEVDPRGGLGLYQIQIEGRFNWDNEDVYAYNFETEKMEAYTIHKEAMQNVEENIKAGIMIFQEALRRNDYDVARAIQEYNYGYGNMREVLSACYGEDEGDGRTDLDWLDYRNVIKNGDPRYVENVLQFVPDGTVFTITRKDGTTITIRYNNLNQNHDMSENETDTQAKRV